MDSTDELRKILTDAGLDPRLHGGVPSAVRLLVRQRDEARTETAKLQVHVAELQDVACRAESPTTGLCLSCGQPWTCDGYYADITPDKAPADHAAMFRWNPAAECWVVECSDCRYDSGACDSLAIATDRFVSGHGLVAGAVVSEGQEKR